MKRESQYTKGVRFNEYPGHLLLIQQGRSLREFRGAPVFFVSLTAFRVPPIRSPVLRLRASTVFLATPLPRLP